MKAFKRIIRVGVSLCVLLCWLCDASYATGSNPSSSGRRKFKSSSIMKKRKKDKSAISRRKHFGEKQKKGPSSSAKPVTP